ncbi:MAG: restriction endonuclease subunit S [bacterium]|nr:restriction endonuclease subunit S [bacterium]
MINLITDHIDIWTGAQTLKVNGGRGRTKSSNGQGQHGIKKLRELILELAVRGKLVPQDPNDEPASVLLGKIAAEKAQLVKEGKIKKQKTLPEIGEEEKPFELPEGWEWFRVGNVLDFQYGKALPKKNRDDSGNIDVYGSNGIVGKHTNSIINEPCIVIGRKGSAGALNKAFQPSWTTDVAYFTLPPAGLNYNYTFLFLQSLRLDKLGKGIKPGLNRNEAYLLLVALPPLDEQHRIVAKVKELMALCDRLEQQQTDSHETHQTLVETLLKTLTDAADQQDFEAAWERIAQHFDILFTTEQSVDLLQQAILQLAVMGKLVPQDLKGSVKKNYSNQVRSERRLNRLPENIKGSNIDLCSEICKFINFPPQWDVIPLSKIALSIVDCPHSTPKWTKKGKICVRTNQFSPGFLDLTISKFVSETTFKKRIERLKPIENDVLYSREGGILGVACRVPKGTELCLGQRMMLLRPSSVILPIFLEMVLNSPLITTIAKEKTTGGAAPRVNVSTVKSYPIPLPSIDEQQRIVTKANELLDLCDTLKASLRDAQTTQVQLADAIVERAVG